LVLARRLASWVSERQDIVWIDCNPQAGREMRDRHAFQVLSPRGFNERTSLVVGLPMTTAACNACVSRLALVTPGRASAPALPEACPAPCSTVGGGVSCPRLPARGLGATVLE